MSQQSTSASEPNLGVIRISDFSQGIVKYGRGTDLPKAGPFAPIGSAEFAYRCINQTGVGLVPLPSHTSPDTIIPAGTVYSPPIVPLQITGLRTIGPVGVAGTQPQANTTPPDIVYVVVNYQTDNTGPNNGHRLSELWRFAECIGPGHATRLLTTPTDIFPSICHGASLSNTRISFTDASSHVWAVNCTVFVDVGSGYYWLTPASVTNPGDTDISASGTLLPTVNRYKAAFAHEFRIVFFSEVLTRVGTQLGPGGLGLNFLSFEDIVYTDPPETSTLVSLTGAAVPHYDPEDMSSFGAWGSINSGELVLIRQGRGGILLNGDMVSPDVTKLPGIVGTGIIAQQGVNSALGMIYLSEGAGAFAWNGSNTSQYLSMQIPDDALERPAVTNHWIAGENAQNDVWGPWALFANNWLFDTDSRSWWQIEDPAVTNLECWARSTYSRFMWACEGTRDTISGTWNIPLVLFDRMKPVTSWVWKSNPVTSFVGSFTTIERIEVLATNTDTTNHCTITVSFSGIAGSDTNPVSFDIPPNTYGIRLLEHTAYKAGAPQITVTSTNAGSGPAPTLHEIDLYVQPTSPIRR